MASSPDSPTNIAPSGPSRDTLYAIAQSQHGYFSTSQALEAGYSKPLLNKHTRNGQFRSMRRGIYRLVHFPTSDFEEFVVLWLWTKHLGVLSHETALALHDLSDILPNKVTMTVPASWSKRRLRKPDGLELRYADLVRNELSHFGAVPITTPLRTLSDCIESHTTPDLIDQALRQARQRGLVSQNEARRLRTQLKRALGSP